MPNSQLPTTPNSRFPNPNNVQLSVIGSWDLGIEVVGSLGIGCWELKCYSAALAERRTFESREEREPEGRPEGPPLRRDRSARDRRDDRHPAGSCRPVA